MDSSTATTVSSDLGTSTRAVSRRGEEEEEETTSLSFSSPSPVTSSNVQEEEEDDDEGVDDSSAVKPNERNRIIKSRNFRHATLSSNVNDDDDEVTASISATQPPSASVAGGGECMDVHEGAAVGIPSPKGPPKYPILSKVYARDEKTLMLDEAIIRRSVFGPVSKQVNVHLLAAEHSDDEQSQSQFLGNFRQDTTTGDHVDVDDDDDDDEKKTDGQTYAWHYFVHYRGWNVRWDRWVDEDSLYDDTENTRRLASDLKAELRKWQAKCRKSKGTKLNIMQLQKSLIALEKKHLSTKGAKQNKTMKKAKKLTVEKPEDAETAVPNTTEKEVETKLTASRKRKRNTTEDGPPKLSKKILEREHKLLQRGLEGRRKQAHAEMLVLPFTLKKVLVDEWEVISQCNMLPNLPATVTVREVLDRYLQSKLSILQQDRAANASDGDNEQDSPSSATQEPELSTSNIETGENCQFSPGSREQEWVDMTKGIAQFFDEALPVQLLYHQEIPKHQQQFGHAPKKRPSSPPPQPHRRMCEIYSCEYLLRLFIRFPSLLAQSTANEGEKRRILAKMGDFIRFLQKHQSELFVQTYHRPSVLGDAENKTVSKSNKKPRQTKKKRESDAKSSAA